MTIDEKRRVYSDRDWWQSAGDVFDLDLRGWTHRSEASFADNKTGSRIEMPGWLAERILAYESAKQKELRSGGDIVERLMARAGADPVYETERLMAEAADKIMQLKALLSRRESRMASPTAAVPGDVGLPTEEEIAELVAKHRWDSDWDDTTARAILSLIRPAFEAKERERDSLVAMAGCGLRSLAAIMKATFSGRGVDISDDEAERAAIRATELIIYSAMAGNPREWCLSCGTVSGDGQCHCTEPFAAASCNRKARHYISEIQSEARTSHARALAAEAKLAQAVAIAEGKTEVGVRHNDDGTIDEVVAKGVTAHLEQMDKGSWYLGLYSATGETWQFWLSAKNAQRTAVDIYHEHSPARSASARGETK